MLFGMIDKQFIGAVVGLAGAFASTFAGVFFAQKIADDRERAQRQAAFESLLRVIDTNCDATIAQIDGERPTVFPTALTIPSILFFSLHENAVMMDSIDRDTTAKLILAIAEVDKLGKQYDLLAGTYAQKHAQLVEPQSLPPSIIGTTIPGYNEYDEMMFYYRQKQAELEEKFAAIQERYADFEEKVGVACSMIKDLSMR